MALVLSAARAGEWMQVSCVNPDGSVAPYQGWSGTSDGSPEFDSNNHALSFRTASVCSQQADVRITASVR